MKILNLYRLNRLWLSVVAILLGVLAGSAIGRESILHTVNARLGNYAQRVVNRDEEVAAEIVNVLAQADASKFPPCSDQDVALLRRLTFGARFLKDVGRLRENEFICSATTGQLPAPFPMPAPDIILEGGLSMYRSLPLVVPSGIQAEILTYRNANVVVSPDLYSDYPKEPIHYAAGIPNRATAKATAGPRAMRVKSAPSGGSVLWGVAGTEKLPPGVLESRQAERFGDTLYRARCSTRFEVCAVASIRMADVWTINSALMYGFTATGGIAGFSCASALVLVGRKRRSHSNQLKRAILTGKLSVAYQPIVELGSHRIVGAEALARWIDEDGESIRPETIIALAEAEGFVSEITRFVITRSLAEIQPILEWHPEFRLSINLAPADLADPRLLLLLDDRLASSLVQPANIAFELPEQATRDRDIAVAAIRRLRDRGHAIFIDDFGTGYSNLAYLTELNVHGIKINRSFIATLGTDSVTASIVPQILAVARALDLSVVVQGIEREDQATYFASDNPMILGQGWFFGLPVPASGLIYLCAERSE